MSVFNFLKRKKEKKEWIEEKNLQTTELKFTQEERQTIPVKTDRIPEEPDTNLIELEKKQVNLKSKEDRKRAIRENCEQIMETTKHIEDFRVEYQAVTSYLEDMQKIDLIAGQERAIIDEAAKSIIALNEEKAKYKKNGMKITEEQFRRLEKFEKIIPKEVKKLEEAEQYQLVLKNDMRHLEGEKGALKFEKEEVIQKQKFLKGLSIILFILVITLFFLFVIVSYAFPIDMKLPYIITIGLAAVGSFYLFFDARKNQQAMILVERKQNRAISLMNKIKIKYINNTNVIDYAYNKFMVNNAPELRYQWEQYQKAKEEARLYRKNTEFLVINEKRLVAELKKFEIIDPDIWIYQATALVDQKEMVEVRHRLNVRRQKLRTNIDYNSTLKDASIQDIQFMIQNSQELKEEVRQILREYNIKI